MRYHIVLHIYFSNLFIDKMCQMWLKIRQGVRWKPREQFSLACKALDLKNVKTIEVSLDPFNPKNESIREFWFQISGMKVRTTNPSIKILSEIRNDRKDPFIITELNNGQKYKFHTANFPSADLVKTFNKITSK